MKLKELMAIADEAYPDGLVWRYYKQPRKNHGDTLAQFIVRELKDTYDAGATDAAQLAEATRVMISASREIWNVIRAFTAAGCKVLRKEMVPDEV